MDNTSRMNELEELGRIDSEHADSPRGRRDLRSERKRVVGKLEKKKYRKHGGSMTKSTRGYGAARTSGMGLQDEQLQPGKVVKAKGGVSIKTKLNGTLRTQTY
tara:strand:- start:30 stop:338 length:309 start_codon:yes stop_codon:yes gene_type:complete